MAVPTDPIDAPAASAAVGDRQLNVWLGGADDGLAMVFHTGTPSPPVRWGALDAAAAARDLRLISYARPGYSGSSRDPGRRVAAAARDTAAVLDALDIREFITIGASGGGPHALACAALLPGRCLAAATVASVAPFDADGLDWFAGMAEENVQEFALARRGEDELRAYLDAALRGLAEVTADQVAAALGEGLISQIDRRALTGEAADVMARSLRRVAADGLDGWVDDDKAFTTPWGFALDAVHVPVAVWQGGQDRMVPFAHGEWLNAHLEAEPRLMGDDGHISLLTHHLEDVLTDLRGLAGKVAP